MRGKRARNIRKLIQFKLPVKADMRIGKKTSKIVYFPDDYGKFQAQKVDRICAVNAAKATYKNAKRQTKGLKIPNLDKSPQSVLRTEVEDNSSE